MRVSFSSSALLIKSTSLCIRFSLALSNHINVSPVSVTLIVLFLGLYAGRFRFGLSSPLDVSGFMCHTLPMPTSAVNPDPNPLRALREEARLSVTALALRAKTSQQLIIRCEQGVYHEPPPRVLNALRAYGPGFDDAELLARYHAWQSATRRASRARGHLPADFDFRVTRLPRSHPFVEWRLTGSDPLLSRIGVSKAYCVHPATVFKYEKQVWLCDTTPVGILDALLDAGYPQEVLKTLEQAYQSFKRSQAARVSFGDAS